MNSGEKDDAALPAAWPDRGEFMTSIRFACALGLALLTGTTGIALGQTTPAAPPAAAPAAAPAAQPWLTSLITETPAEGYELAVRISRRAIPLTQSDVAVRRRLRPEYAENADSIIAISHLISVNFATVAAANNYWRR
jgi:hypothetical protein